MPPAYEPGVLIRHSALDAESIFLLFFLRELRGEFFPFLQMPPAYVPGVRALNRIERQVAITGSNFFPS